MISFLTNIIGPLVPDIIESFDLSLTLVALLPFSFFIAYGIMSIPSGILIEKIGEGKVMIWAFFMSAVGAFLLVFFPYYSVYLLSLFLIGTGMAMLQVAINPLLRVIGGESQFAFNSVLGQLFFGLASFLSPLVYSYLVKNIGTPNQGNFLEFLSRIVPADMTWLSLYWVFAVISILMVITIAICKIPRIERNEDEKTGAWQSHNYLLKNPKVVLFFLGILCYVGSEQGVANWISQFLETYHGLDPQTVGAQTVSRFWGMMTAGTLLGLVLLKFLDSRIVLISFTLAAIMSLLVAINGTSKMALIGFPLVGFFASVMWSIIVSLALNSVEKYHGSFSGILMTGIAGGAIVPLIVGLIGDNFGLQNALYFLLIPLIFIFSIGFWAKPLINNETILSQKNNN